MKRPSAMCVAAGSAVAALVLSTPASGISINADDDFSTTQNPNAPWSYREAGDGVANSSSTLMASCCSAGGWFGAEGGGWPIVSGTLMHPGNASDAILAFEFLNIYVPGIISLQLDVTDGNADSLLRDDGQILTIWKNDNLLRTNTLPRNFIGSPLAIQENITLNHGDIVYIRVDRNADFFFDSLTYDATFTVTIPEPAAAALALFGLVALAVGRRALRG